MRRELRELVKTDRELYFDGVEQMHRLSLLDGISTFGKNFRNYESMTIKHLDSRTVQGCTPYHGSNVFLTSHSAFNLEFEQSLQAIHPMLAAPFWDYTIDDSLYGRDWYHQSIIMSSEFYGNDVTTFTSSDVTTTSDSSVTSSEEASGNDVSSSSVPQALGVDVGKGPDGLQDGVSEGVDGVQEDSSVGEGVDKLQEDTAASEGSLLLNADHALQVGS